jgi:hypothetical protein
MLARDVFSSVAINTGTEEVPVWTEIGGITQVTPDTSSNMVDDTDFQDAGWQKQKIAQRGKSLKLSGNYLEDPDSGEQDLGQQALFAAGDMVGYDSTVMFKTTSIGGGETAFEAIVEASWGGGGNNDNGTFDATLTVNGQTTYTPGT